MKTPAASSARIFLSPIVFLALTLSARAIPYYWDPNGTGNGSTSGSGDGTWNTTLNVWHDGSALGAWVSSATSEAVFGGTGATSPDNHDVTLGTAISLNKLTVNSARYVITGAGANTLNFIGTNATITGNVATTISAPIVLSGTLFTAGDNGGSDTISLTARISESSGNVGSIQVNSGSRLSLNSTNGNTFTGGVTVNGGTLIVRSNSSGNNLGTGGLTLNGGTFATAYNGGGSDRTLTNTKANVNVTASSTFRVDRSDSNTNNTIEMDALSIGASTLTVTAGNSYSLSFAGATTLSGNATFSLASSVGSSTKYGLSLGNVGQTGEARGITKSGTGNMAINGTATYTGTTTVSDGGFYINGNAGAATGNITTAAGTTLGGIGTVGALNTTISGIHAPGELNAIGTQTFNNLLTYAAGSSLAWQIDAGATDPGPAVANAGSYDRIISNGGIARSGTGTITFGISLAVGAFSDAFWDTDKSWSNIYTGVSDLTSIFNAFGGSVAADGSVAGEGQFSFSGSNLIWTAVPEPTFALILPTLAGTLLRRRRK